MVLVVSPLVSLVVDQVADLQQRGIAAGILSANTGVPDIYTNTHKQLMVIL